MSDDFGGWEPLYSYFIRNDHEVRFDGEDLYVEEIVVGCHGYRSYAFIPIAVITNLLSKHGYKVVKDSDK